MNVSVAIALRRPLESKPDGIETSSVPAERRDLK